MPLKIELKPGERAIINGAVIEGTSDGRTEFVLLNRATVLRQRHIMKEEQADTPVKRLYFTIQMLYIEPALADTYLGLYDKYYQDLATALSLPTMRFALEQINICVKSGEYYEGMKICRAMIETEERFFYLGDYINKQHESENSQPVEAAAQ